ncbi:MAG: acetyl-CoA carboxylase biotin carboxyl carrier protein subunit [Muribaculaceae bacterium]|nr:acetyl-CoA carboxylase biotin carboxyl carrier protein subunit [Muribaculaceae bacterium]
MSQKEYKYKINGIKFNVTVDDPQGNSVHVEVNGVPYTVELDNTPNDKPVIKPPKTKPVQVPRLNSEEKRDVEVVTPANGYTVKAPLPGTIMTIPVKVGDQVAAGATVCVLEAMKMENDIHTPKGGVVKQILVNVGDAVPQDGNLMILE